MIATDHQYGITSERLRRFAEALDAVSGTSGDDPFRSSQAEGIRAQMGELAREMREYDELRSGGVTQIDAETLTDLPIALIKARIARGLTQSALAELLGAKQQLVQRWEADRYRKASLATLNQVARALNVRVSERVSLDGEPPVPLAAVRRGLRNLGFPKEFVERRLFPVRDRSEEDVTLSDEVDARLTYLIGLGSRAVAQASVQLSPAPIRHKLPAAANPARTRAYSRYVAGLCAIAAKCAAPDGRPLPADWRVMRAALFPEGRPSLVAAVEALWDRGIPVLPLADAVAFHGACWRVAGRTVIVLKQGATDEARWLFDLAHEAYHAAAEPEGQDFLIVEGDEASPERRTDREELRANRFAAELLTNGRLKELTDRVVALAGREEPRLKSATSRVAAEAGVGVGVLANLLAHRLAEGGNAGWWATAATLQPQGEDARRLVRDVFLRRADPGRLSRMEADLLNQCLEMEDGWD